MNKAMVARNVVDINRDPDFRSERRSQLLFGEVVEAISESGKYTQIRQSDGYNGWSRSEALRTLDDTDFARLSGAPRYRVVSSVATVFDDDHSPSAPFFLSYGSTVHVLGFTDNSGDKRVELAYRPHERRWISAADLIPDPFLGSEEKRDPDDVAENIIIAAFQFLGVPYLWGGASALGLDCSGLSQLVYSMHGIAIPRDSIDQRAVGREIPRGQCQAADLIFFEGHVAISLGASTIIHASLGEGGVALNSLEKGQPGYRQDLDETYIVTRRYL